MGVSVPACLCPSFLTFLLCFFLWSVVSVKLLLIHHPAATGLSCDWAQHTLPPAKMICRPELDSYRLWQGHRAVWHNITHKQTHTKVCVGWIHYFDHCPNRNASKSTASTFESQNWSNILMWSEGKTFSTCGYTSTRRQIQTPYTGGDKAHRATAYLSLHVWETVHILSVWQAHLFSLSPRDPISCSQPVHALL